MKKLLWDLDGVIRDLHSMIKDWNPQYWDDPLPTGESIFDYFKKNPNHLTYAEPTEYYKIIPKEITIITCQPEEWRQYTAKWLKVYCPKANIIYVDKPEDKFIYLKKDDLIEIIFRQKNEMDILKSQIQQLEYKMNCYLNSTV